MLERFNTSQFIKKLEFIRLIEPPAAEVIDRECDRFCQSGEVRPGFEPSDIQAIHVWSIEGELVAIVTILIRESTAYCFDIRAEYEAPPDDYLLDRSS